MQFNCNGLSSRLTGLKRNIAKIRPHAILLQETLLTPMQPVPRIPGYNVAARQDHDQPASPGPATAGLDDVTSQPINPDPNTYCVATKIHVHGMTDITMSTFTSRLQDAPPAKARSSRRSSSTACGPLDRPSSEGTSTRTTSAGTHTNRRTPKVMPSRRGR